MALQTGILKIRYFITGLILGTIISIIISFITISTNNYSFSISSIIQMSRENPANLFLIISPIIILSIIGYISGLNIEKEIFKSYFYIKQNNTRFEYIYNFVETIRKGEAKTNIEKILEKDKIGISLINLKNEIKKNKEENVAKQEEEVQRRWISEGLALFGAILREYNESIEIMANKIISELVKYTDIKQAGFYIISENENKEKNIKEIANFAYGKKRLANKEILWGEGLIGACIIEKKTSFLKDVNNDYTEIESGLGAAKPKSILIVPLMTDEGVVHGAIEFASFKTFKDFEIQFAEQIAESIATTISSIKINEETTKLLEESKKHAGTMAKQEEKLLKTISDMERLQANADIQSSKFRTYQNSTNKSLIIAEFSIDGNLVFTNKKFLHLMGYNSNSEIKNKNISKLLHSENTNWFENNKENILSNSHFEGLLNYTTKNGNIVWVKSSYIGLKNDKGIVKKILLLGTDATELKNKTENLTKKIISLEESVLKAELSLSGEIINFNDKLLNLLNYSYDDIIHQQINDYIDSDEANNLITIIENLKNTKTSFEGEFSIKDKNNAKIWLKGNIFQEFDINDNAISINIIAFDQTSEHFIKQKINDFENEIADKDKEIITLKDRLVKRVDQAKEEMKNIYVETETSNIFFEQTLKFIPNAVLSINNDNKIVFINNTAKILFSIDDNCLGKEITSLLPEISDELEGIYLGKIFNYNNDNLPTNKQENIFILDKEGNKKTLKMDMNEVIIGLRKQLTVFLYE